MIRMDNMHDFLRSRRSVRRFKPEAVSESVFRTILTTAGFAPSAHNRQPWRYVVITSAEQKNALAEAMGEEFRHDLLADGRTSDEAEAQVRKSRRRIETAPVVVALCADFTCADNYLDRKRQAADSLMLVQDTALGGMQFMLAAHAEGLASCWMCAPLFAPDTVRVTLALPDGWDPQALILLGYPEQIPEPRERKPNSEIAIFK
jgi:coenzyme F420-0:L-glutamate ligase/coenzyme F420-1:gamma-L-glutamate ligase